MKRIYHNYIKWEDFHHGLYNTYLLNDKEENELINNCMKLLKDCTYFYSVMQSVITKWKHATEVNLTNTSRNRQAWLGQSSCCYEYGAPEYITKIAWRLLSKEEQDNANLTADKIINKFEKRYNFGISANHEQKRLI